MGMEALDPSNIYDIRDPSDDNTTGFRFLADEEREDYHKLTAQCLYLSKRGKPDLQTSIEFHCTRVRKPDTDNQKKLVKTIRHLIATVYIPLILRVNKHGIVE